MLSKEHRLTKRKDFARVYGKGKSFFVRELGAKAVPNGLDVSRFAFVVSLKVSKKAVERNRIRRRLREIVRKRLSFVRPGFDCAITARAAIKSLDYGEMEKIAEGILAKLGILKI